MSAAGCGDNSQMPPVDSAPDIDAPTGGAQCSDGIDNDGDGKVDFPADPGCLAPQQDTETDDCPSGPHCPQCSNGIDDDGNGTTDYPSDPGCSSASDPIEFIDNPVACGAGLMIKQLPGTGTDTGTLDGTSVSGLATTGCGGGGGAPAIAYQIALTAPKVMVATTAGSDIDTVLDLRGAMCSTDDIECHNDVSGDDSTSKITRSLAAGTYYLILEGHDSSTQGTYALDVRFFTGEGEACSDTSQCGPGLVCRIPMGQTAKVCSKPMCSDGVDDDNDTKADYPDDPGCGNPSDNDETDPSPLPACSDGVDNDNDGKTDYPMDTSCTSAAGGSEACQGEQDPIDSIVAGTTTGTTAGAHDDHQPTCVTSDGGDVLYTLTVPAMRSLVLDTEGTTTDTILSFLTATCAEPGLGCDDDNGTSDGASRLQFANLAAGTYIVAVDDYDGAGNVPGPYNVHVTGVISPGGRCDAQFTLGGALACPATNPCEPGPNSTMLCRPSACGDGMDNDGDGLMDYPNDPGCSALDDNDESDTCASGPGPGCPECADGIDNDGDGQMDYPNDTNCTSPGSQSEGCPTTDGLTAITTPQVSIDTTGANNDVEPPDSCGEDGPNDAPDKTYSLELPALKSLSIVGEFSFDGVLALYNSTCSGTPLDCEDSEDIELTNVAAGNYFLLADGWGDDFGTATLTISGVIQHGASCESPLAQSGALVCGPGFACSGTPGTRTCRPAGCNDGLDNDGDGVADFPNDPGCASPNDSDETDDCPGGPNCPACSDGMDNDGDLLIDYPNDPSCPAASSTTESCSTSEGVTPLVMPLTSDNSAGAFNDDLPACSVPNSAGDKMYSLTIPELSSLSITNTGDFDEVVSLYDSTCGGAPVDCEEFSSDLSFTHMDAGTYYYSIDGWDDENGGAYSILVSGEIVPGGGCEGPLVASGALKCPATYTCKGTAGSRTCELAACSDGIDNDTDGKMDYPVDPGCATPEDDDETDPATPPACSNGTDDNGNGLTDWMMEFGCAAAGDPSEEPCELETDPVTTILTTPVTGTTTGAHNDFASQSCQSNASGPDVALGLYLPVPVDTLVLDLSGSSFDSVLSFRNPGCDISTDCNDDGGSSNNTSKLTLSNVAAGGYSVVIDGWSGRNGPYTLAVQGTVATGTSCTSPLFTSGVLVCPTGTTCTGTPATCQ